MEGQNYTVDAQQFLRISVETFQQLNSAAADEPEAISASSPAGSRTEQSHIQTHPTHAWHFTCSGENAGFQPAPSQSGWCPGMPGEHCTIPNEIRHAVCAELWRMLQKRQYQSIVHTLVLCTLPRHADHVPPHL